MSASDIENIKKEADRIMGIYTRDRLKDDVKILDPKEIIKGTHAYAKGKAYDIKERDPPNQEYITSSFEYIQRVLALAGYRLADILKPILEKIKVD